MRLPLLLPVILLSGCAGYAIDYARPKASLIGPELARYGLDAVEAQCVGEQLGRALSVWQVRQLTDAARSGALTGSADRPLTLEDLRWFASHVEDDDVAPALALAVSYCGMNTIVAESAEAVAAPVEAGPADGASAQSTGKIENGPRDYQPSGALLAALEAYEKGDFPSAARLSISAAARGDSGAQQFLGGLYEFGRGVPADPASAARYYGLAAEQGWSEAMTNLGRSYAKGQGVRQDPVEALKWYLLASRRTTEDEALVIGNIAEVSAGMSYEQIMEASALAQAWEQSHPR